MNILFFIHSLEGGGAESQLRYLSRGLARSGHKVTVVYAQGDERLLRDSSVDLYRLDPGSSYSLSLLFQVFKLVRSVNPDVVQTWTLKFDVLLGLVRRVLPFRWIVRESNNLTGLDLGIKDRLRIGLARKRAAIVANSPGGADYWLSHRAASVSIIENGYDLSFLDQIPTDEMSTEKPRLCYLGRLAHHKRVDRVIRALAQLPSDVLLDVIGDGPEKEALSQLAEELGVCVRFHGYLPQDKALELVAASRALLLLSDYEGTPNVVMEAQYLRVPVVLSNSESHTKFFPADTAFFVSSADAKSVAQAIEKVLSKSSQVDRNVEQASAFARKWTVERMISRYQEFYYQLLG